MGTSRRKAGRIDPSETPDLYSPVNLRADAKALIASAIASGLITPRSTDPRSLVESGIRAGLMRRPPSDSGYLPPTPPRASRRPQRPIPSGGEVGGASESGRDGAAKRALARDPERRAKRGEPAPTGDDGRAEA